MSELYSLSAVAVSCTFYFEVWLFIMLVVWKRRCSTYWRRAEARGRVQEMDQGRACGGFLSETKSARLHTSSSACAEAEGIPISGGDCCRQLLV